MEPELEILAKQRAAMYGDGSWLQTGRILDLLDLSKLSHAGFLSPYVKILSKLVRLTVSPYHKDSWADIIIYADLVYRHIKSGEPVGRGT